MNVSVTLNVVPMVENVLPPATKEKDNKFSFLAQDNFYNIGLQFLEVNEAKTGETFLVGITSSFTKLTFWEVTSCGQNSNDLFADMSN